MTKTYVPTVLTHKTTLMQRLADCVRHGYVHWCSGTVPLERAHRLALKFCDFYATGLSADQRYRRKREGRGNAQLLMWREDDAGPISWWLLVTAGDHPAHSHERLHDARRSRIFVTGYELVQQTRPGQAKPAWTWRMSAETYEGWRARVIAAIRRHADQDLVQAWRGISRVPGFAPVRAQARRVMALVRGEWKRSRGNTPLPVQSMRIPYVSRVPHTSVPLRLLTQACSTPAEQRQSIPRHAAGAPECEACTRDPPI